MSTPSRMPPGSLSRATVLRAVGVIVITATITIAAACSDEDTVDTVPPPWPTPTHTTSGPRGVPTGGYSEAVAGAQQR